MTSHGHLYKTDPRNMISFLPYESVLFPSYPALNNKANMHMQISPFLKKKPEISMPSPSSKQIRVYLQKYFTFPTLNLMLSSAKHNRFIHHKQSAAFVYFVVGAAFIFLCPENNNWYCYICCGHALTSHRSFIKETVRCVLLHLPEGWWALVYLPPSVSNTVFFHTWCIPKLL